MKLTANQEKFVAKVKKALKKFKTENDEATFITLTELGKQTKLGKGRLKDTLHRGKIGMEMVMLDVMKGEGEDAVKVGEQKQFQISL